MKTEFDKHDILYLLSEVNKKLSEQDQHGAITICGGAAQVLIYDSRVSTHDIDALFQPHEAIKAIVSELTQELGLETNWLNDDFKEFSEFERNMRSESFTNFSNLSVNVMNAESLLAMKLLSGRPDTYDMRDAAVLMRHLDIKNLDGVYKIFDDHRTDIMPPRVIAKLKEFAKAAFETYKNNLKE